MRTLRQWSGVLGKDELAARLGRTPLAVESRQTWLGLVTPTKHPEYLTGRRMARALGVDDHSIVRLIERGLLPAELAPVHRKTWLVRRLAFYAWATNPLHWVYFWRSVCDPARLGDEKLRRLILRRAETWQDEWWTMGQVCAYHNAHQTVVGGHILSGRLPAVRWGNWWVLRSEATRPGLRFYGAGMSKFASHGTPDGDAFLVLAAAVGLPWPHIARLMGGRQQSPSLVSRHEAIVRRGLVPWLARAYALPLEVRDGRAWADWRKMGRRFPVLARAWARLADPSYRPPRFERALLSGVLATFLRFHGLERPEWSLKYGDATAANLRAAQRLFEETVR